MNASFTSQIQKELGGQFHDDDEFSDEQNLKCVKFICKIFVSHTATFRCALIYLLFKSLFFIRNFREKISPRRLHFEAKGIKYISYQNNYALFNKILKLLLCIKIKVLEFRCEMRI